MTSDYEVADSKSTATVVHLTADDFRILVTYVEIVDNFKALFGTSKKTPVGGKPLHSKIKAFQKMAEHLNRHTKTENLPTLCGRNMQQRWATFMRKFNRILKKSKTTGAGLTRAEAAEGLSLQAKWERLCPQFTRMCVLFEGRANVKPAATMELGVPAAPTPPAVINVDGDSDNSGNSDVDESAPHRARLGERVDALAEGLGADDLYDSDGASPSTKTVHEKIDDFLEEVEAESKAMAKRKERCDDDDEQWTKDYDSDRLEKSTSTMSSAAASKQSKKHLRSNVKRQKQKKSNVKTGGKQPKADGQTPPKKPKKKKAPKETAQDARLSISQAYTRNMSVKLDYLQQKLEDERSARRESKDEALRQREFDAEQNRLELKERQTARKQNLLLELLDKTPEEIARYMDLF